MANDTFDEQYWDGFDEWNPISETGGLLEIGNGPFMELPFDQLCVVPDAWKSLLCDEQVTTKHLRVLMALIDLMEAYTNEVRTTFSELIEKTGLARGTVVRAVRMFEDMAVIERHSKPNRQSRWMVRPCYASKAVLLRRRGVCGHDDLRHFGYPTPDTNPE
jgi:DNA-binding MarR family transcriptional regulator